MMFLFPRWDMLIPWRVFSSYSHVGFSGLDPQHLRALQVDGRRSLFDQFDPRPKRDSWHQCSGAIPTVGGAEIRKDHQLRWRINPIIYRVFCTSQVIVWDFFHQQSHLKINGWKMKLPFEMIWNGPFLGNMLNLVLGRVYTLKFFHMVHLKISPLEFPETPFDSTIIIILWCKMGLSLGVAAHNPGSLQGGPPRSCKWSYNFYKWPKIR